MLINMGNEFDIKEGYGKLKYKLPDFESLDKEFEVSFIDYKIKDDRFLLTSIRRKVNEKVIFYCRIIEGLLYPHQPNIITMIELNNFNEEEKKKIYALYKKLMGLERESLKLDVINDDKKSAEFINHVFAEWKNYSNEMKWITEKMKESWDKKDKEEEGSYMG